MFECIDHVVYINLDERTDRREQIEKELSRFPCEKVTRFSAIKDTDGAIGCMKSHIACLALAIEHKWNNVLIVEDDSMWSNFSGYHILEEKSKHYDVIMLGSTFASYSSDYRVRNAHSGNAYLVSSHYYAKLMQRLSEGLELLIKTGNRRLYVNDVYWKPLQAEDEWYVVVPSLMIQRPSFSNINNTFEDYGRLFT